jgi:hypothetical protein
LGPGSFQRQVFGVVNRITQGTVGGRLGCRSTLRSSYCGRLSDIRSSLGGIGTALQLVESTQHRDGAGRRVDLHFTGQMRFCVDQRISDANRVVVDRKSRMTNRDVVVSDDSRAGIDTDGDVATAGDIARQGSRPQRGIGRSSAVRDKGLDSNGGVIETGTRVRSLRTERP